MMWKIVGVMVVFQFTVVVKATDEDCNEPLVLPGNVTLTSTTSRNPSASFGPQQALLHNTHAWCASLSNADQYLVIDMGLVKMIKSIAIQGNPNNDEFVKTFSVSYAVLEGQWLTYTEIGARRTFIGNSNGGETTEQVFKNIFAARYVRIVAESWYNHVCARVQLFGCDATPFRGLGMMSGEIPDGAITASSIWHGGGHEPYKGRLYWTKYANLQLWAANSLNTDQWLQIDLSRLEFVTAIATQGRHGGGQWVQSYWFSYGTDGTTFIAYKENNVKKVFTGNSDGHTVVRHALSPVIYTRFVRFNPQTWYSHISMRAEVYSYGRDFPADLGIENKEIPDSQITASSEYDHLHAAHMGRLNNQVEGVLAWCSNPSNLNSNQWIQFDFGHTMIVTGVVTQGRGNGGLQWTTFYKVFTGNSDGISYVTNTFNRDVKARSIRINPTAWHNFISLRASVIGRRKGKLGSPVFTNQEAPTYITVYKNQDVILKCEAVGDTPITITWTHKGQVLQSKTSDTHLNLTNVNTAHEGFYKCSATNTRGANNKNIYLHVKGSFDICSNQHSLISGNTRLITSSVPYVNDDSNLNETMWYVFKSTKGFSRIPSTCVAQNHCGATAPGYMQGALPTVSEGIVKRKICFHNNGDCCQYSVDIYVRNCYMFYVYKLKKLDSSWKARYCNEDYINDKPARMFQSLNGPSFTIPNQFITSRLHGVDSDSTCMQYCMLDDSCKSFSYNPNVNMCELNNATKNQFSNQALPLRPDYRYFDEVEVAAP